jgi:hypothetical protein
MANTASGAAQPQTCPIDDAGFFSELSLAWMDDLMARGAAKPLEQDDIFEPPAADSVDACALRFEAAWAAEKQVCACRSIRTISDGIHARCYANFSHL